MQHQRRVRPWVREAVAWGAALAFPFALLAMLGPSEPGEPAVTRFLVPTAATVLLVGLFRRRPLPALALMLAGSLAASMTDHSWQLGYLQAVVHDVAVGYIAATRSRRASVVAAVATLAMQIVAATYYTGPAPGRPGSPPPAGLAHPSALDGPDFFRTIALLLLAVAAAWMMGRRVAEGRAHAEATRVQATAQAVTAERLRIARELHDMVAHSIGVIALQAGMGSRVIDTQPAEARQALSAIEATSRETLSGLRRMLGALRRADAGPAEGGPPSAPTRLTTPPPAEDTGDAATGAAAGPTSSLVPLEPAPGLGDLDRLAEGTRAVGVEVDVDWRGERRPLPAEIELSAFRVVQEAVTNVVRHAGTDRCRVSVDYGDDELTIEVVDEGRGLDGTGGASGGYGLIGMRERVGLLGGDLTAERRPEGGFRVVARLPLPAEAQQVRQVQQGRQVRQRR